MERLTNLTPRLCRVVADLLQFSKQAGCYKTILDCSDDNVPFYEKCGLTKKEVQMVSGCSRKSMQRVCDLFCLMSMLCSLNYCHVCRSFTLIGNWTQRPQACAPK